MVLPTRLVCLVWLITCLSFNVKAQDFSIKSKYQYAPKEASKGNSLIQGLKFSEAIKEFNSLLKRANDAGDNRLAIFAMERKAYAERRSGDFEQALITISEAIARAKNQLDENDMLLSRLYFRAGVIQYRDYEFTNALYYLDTAQAVYQISDSYDSAFYKSLVDYKYYSLNSTNGNSDTLQKYLDIRLKIAQQNKDKEEELYILQDYPDFYSNLGDFEQALFYAIRAYKLATENLQPNPKNDVNIDISNKRTISFTMFKLAGVLRNKKDYTKALEVALQIIPIIDKYGPKSFPNYHAYYQGVGVIYVSLGQYEEALPYLEKAGEIDIKTSAAKRFYGINLVNIGNCYLQMGEEEKAYEILNKSFAVLKEVVSFPSSDYYFPHENLGNFYVKETEFNKAFIQYDSALRNSLGNYYEGALSFPEGENFSYYDLEALRKKASTLLNIEVDTLSEVERLNISKSYAERTHKLLFDRRKDLSASEGKLFLSKQFKPLYETAIEACYGLWKATGNEKYFYDALQFSRYSKAILFLEQSEELELVNNNLATQDLKESFYMAKTQLDSLEGGFYALIDSNITSDSLSQINDVLNSARNRFQNVVDSLRTYLGEFENQPNTVFKDLENPISARSIKSGEGIIEYFYGEESIFALGQDSENKVFVKVDELDSIQNGLLNIFSSVSKAPEIKDFDKKLDHFNKHSFYVYKSIIKPVLDSFSDKTKYLTIIPDDYLSRLPFEILITSDIEPSNFNSLPYLIREYSVQYELSNSLINNHNYKKRKKEVSGLLGIGYRSGDLASSRSQYGDLPGTEREINFLKASVEGTYFLGGTKQDFLENARNYDILHLAIHGEADTVNKYQSSLIFSGSGNTQLQTSDLYLAGLNARLAVLSACESGVGLITKGEGTFSIARGFSLVGVPSIVMSLWKVNDKITSRLMVDMHEKFNKEGEPINEALRQAKLNYLNNSDAYLSHPYYWSAFIQLGENVESNEGKRNGLLVVVLSAGVLLTILAIFIYRKKRRRTI